jgi:hypothetical protein
MLFLVIINNIYWKIFLRSFNSLYSYRGLSFCTMPL